ncbi:hypothetical protein ACIQ6R_06255 [Streptomyces sp. NPDC096048]|uniref:hypothetical protein n=1 Tax=Streptomyces sp. NPDC096048 TaxID=3366072 RepID=UPI0038262510
MSTTAAALITLAIVVGLPAVWCHGFWSRGRITARVAAERAERAARPPAQHIGLEDGVVAVALAAACCERWWTSAGAEHEPTTCTRKDQTT